jgi:hypothetical protein
MLDAGKKQIEDDAQAIVMGARLSKQGDQVGYSI